MKIVRTNPKSDFRSIKMSLGTQKRRLCTNYKCYFEGSLLNAQMHTNMCNVMFWLFSSPNSPTHLIERF